MKNFDDLEFGPPLWADGFRYIPEYLFEQVDEVTIDLNTLYKIGPLFIAAGAMIYPLSDAEHIIKGILWLQANFIEDVLYVQLLSVDPEYQDGQAIEKTKDFLKQTGKTVRWATKRPEVFERKGFSRSPVVLMELKGDDDTFDKQIKSSMEK